MKDSELIRKLHNGDKEAIGLKVKTENRKVTKKTQPGVVKNLRIKIPTTPC